MLVPLELPPGVYANGTDLQASGRWLDASLVRWTEGTMRPVGGWSTRVDTSVAKAPRGAIAWTDNSGDRRIAFGTYDGLHTVNVSNTYSDITPVGLTAGREGATQNVGFGGSFYGTGLYGTQRSVTSAMLPATTWALDTWGENLIACSSDDGAIYEWALDTDVKPVAVTNAPTSNAGAFVTEERFLVAIGAGGEPRKVQWSDREVNTTWTAAATNEAGSFTLQSSGSLMVGVRGRGQSLLLTDHDAHVMTYQGPPFVYGFEKVGSACGVASKLAAMAVGGAVYWMGQHGFYRHTGGGVEEVPCDVSDYVFTNLNTSQISKVWAVTNTKHDEVWWFYPRGAEIDSYVVYNYKEGHWTIGSLSRTAGVDSEVFSNPVWLDAEAVLYNHETGNQYGGDDVYAESGPVILNADGVVSVTDLIPDEETIGDVNVTFRTRFYPQGDEYDHGPYSMATPTSVRFSGRQVRMRVTGTALTSWRWGVPRIDVKAMGRR